MSLSNYPKIPTENMVFCIDKNNTWKSWIGKPTTNLISNASNFSGWSNYYRTTLATPFTTQFGTTGYRFLNQPSWNGLYIGISIPSLTTHTFSCWFRYLGGSGNNNGGAVYISGFGQSDQATAVNKNLIGKWQRLSHTVTNPTSSSGTLYLISWGGTDNGTGNPDWSSSEITMPQFESGTFATRFVNGTRSTTGSFLDMAQNRTLTANNMVYNNDNTYSFNGTNSSIDFSTTGYAMNTQQTIIIVLKPTENDGVRRNPYNHEYAGWGTITHETSGQFNYYHGSGGGNTSPYQGTTSTFTVAQNEKAMIAVSRGTSNVKWYKNGVLSDTIANSYPNAVNTVSTANIGTGYAGAYQGDIDFVALYNRQLTDAEIASAYNVLKWRYSI